MKSHKGLENTSEKKCVVLLSGGLDSRLAVKIMQEQGFEVTVLFFNLPFGTGCCDEKCSFNFTQLQGVKMEIIEVSKGEYLQEYLDIIKKGEHGRGAGINPCVDCRIFIFSKAREYADKNGIELVVTGEVLGERPMSQMTRSMRIIEEKSGLKGRLLRPLSAKLLPPTEAEKRGLVDREKLYDIYGRRRVRQMELAKKFGISYPSPGGGCLLCEKALKKRFKFLVERGMDDNEIKLAEIGRHFVIDGCWIVLGRDKRENQIIEFLAKKNEKCTLIVPEEKGPSAIILDRCGEDTLKEVNELIKAYSKGSLIEERKKFEKYKI